MIEVMGKNLNLIIKKVCPLGMVRQSSDFISTGEQKARSIFPRV
jgi:hypothetical protein